MWKMTTERLVLRELDARDAENVFLLNSDPEVLRYVHDTPFPDRAAARAWIANIPVQLPRGIGRYAIETRAGQWMGRCSLRVEPDGEVLVGYRLMRQFWGQGFASETVAALLELAFGVHQLPFVCAKVARENLASRKVAEKNGGWLCREAPCGSFADALVYRFDRPGNADG
jgi:RimJ/RimL family protein N-acetyltransferase